MQVVIRVLSHFCTPLLVWREREGEREGGEREREGGGREREREREREGGREKDRQTDSQTENSVKEESNRRWKLDCTCRIVICNF